MIPQFKIDEPESRKARSQPTTLTIKIDDFLNNHPYINLASKVTFETKPQTPLVRMEYIIYSTPKKRRITNIPELQSISSGGFYLLHRHLVDSFILWNDFSFSSVFVLMEQNEMKNISLKKTFNLSLLISVQ